MSVLWSQLTGRGVGTCIGGSRLFWELYLRQRDSKLIWLIVEWKWYHLQNYWQCPFLTLGTGKERWPCCGSSKEWSRCTERSRIKRNRESSSWSLQFSSVQSLSCVWLFVTPWIAARQASLSITISQSSLRLMSIKSVMPSSHLTLCRPLLFLPPIPPSIRVFSSESTLRRRWPKYWSFSFSIIPSKEIPGLISFSMDWMDLLAVQGTLKSLLQHHSSKASILRHSAFFTVQLSHPYMATGKTIALTRQTLLVS